VNNKTRRIRILGQGGTGKTTTLEFLFNQDALNYKKHPSSSKLPVIISLSSLAIDETIIERIAKKISSEVNDAEGLLRTNRMNIYLDGVNEILDSRESKRMKLQEIGSFIDDFPDLSIVISDRFEYDSYQSNMFNVPSYLIQKLSSNQIQEFVEKYCDEDDSLSDRVMRTLKSKEGIEELLLRPLVLTRAIEIIKIDNDLPKQEGQIIEKFLDILLKREKDEKKDPLLNVNNFKLLLSYVADFVWKEKNKSNIPIHEFTFRKLLLKAASELGMEKSNAGYILRIGYELEILSKNDEYIQFYHQSYLEFFVTYFLNFDLR
jgi:predicted NACHT family NTPase